MRHRRVLKLAAVIGLLLCTMPAACSAPGSGPAERPTPTPLPTAVVPEKQTYTVQRGTIVASLAFTARVSPVHEAELFFRTDGRVLAVYVATGDAVKAGDRLAELDVSAVHRQLAQATLALETARTELASANAARAYELARARLNLGLEQVALDKLKDYDPQLDVAAARAQLGQADTALRQAQSRYDAVASLPDVGMRPESEALQQATLSYRIAKSAYDQAAQQADQHAYDIQSQQKRVELAQLDVDRLQGGANPLLEQAVARAELDLAGVRAQITDTVVTAPFDGRVAAVTIAAGQAAEAFAPVLVVADPAALEVTAELSADEMKRLSEGQAATLAPADYPGQVLTGTIRSLPYPYGSGGSTAALPGQDRTTHLAVDLAGVPVAPGDLVRVTAVLDKKEDVLWLPPSALRTFEGRHFVVVQEGAGQRRVDVTLGIETEDRVEIVAGLSEGQLVLAP